MTELKKERLQKVLARSGYGSRRHIETLIEAGRVAVNGVVATLGDGVISRDRITIDGRMANLADTEIEVRVVVYHKPEGQVCTRSDPEGRPTIFEHVPAPRGSRWVTVGRLDLNSSGLLLLTTDGELANRLMHPSNEIEREYAVRVLGAVEDSALEALTEGVTLEDGPAHFESITDAGGSGANHWYSVVIKEGRKREVRRLWESQGITVSRLIRTRLGPITMPKGLRSGHWQDLDANQIAQLMSAAGLEPAPRVVTPSKPKRSDKTARPDKAARPTKPARPSTRGKRPTAFKSDDKKTIPAKRKRLHLR